MPEHATPYPGNLLKCPKCGHKRFDYMAEDYGACERRQCGYEWHRSRETVTTPDGWGPDRKCPDTCG